MAVHVGHLTALDAIRACYDAITTNAARILHLDGYGIFPGARANVVLLQAADAFEAIRLKATRLAVVRNGKVIARTAEKYSALNLDGRPDKVTLNFKPGSIA
jgi:cytosine deaminase